MAQDLKVEFDPKTDLTHCKTFRFGEGEIITPSDLRRVPDSTLHGWVRRAVFEELIKKGLKQSDSADLVVSYIVGSRKLTDVGKVGPLGMTPGSNEQNYQRDYREGSLVVDLNDPTSNKLIWRVNAIMNTDNPDIDGLINSIVSKGFKKFSIMPKKQNRKK
jgi:hypothetical protein